jgi:hypothetical protein
MNKINRYCLAAFISFSASTAFANESDARLIFANGISSALNFKSQSIIEDIGVALPQFTSNGRNQLISVYERTGIIREAVKNNGSMQTNVQSGNLVTTKMVGRDGLEQFRFSGVATIQWQRCVSKTCVPVGESKEAKISGVAIPTQINGRPTYKVDAVNLEQ